MFEAEQAKVENMIEANKWLGWVWPVLKTILACILITQLDYGILVVVAYLIFQVDGLQRLQVINAKQADLQFNILHGKIAELEERLEPKTGNDQ